MGKGNAMTYNRLSRGVRRALLTSLLATSALAAPKDCAELKAEIEAKIQANGVTVYTLKIVDKGSEPDMQVVGSCAGGSKEIVYKRG